MTTYTTYTSRAHKTYSGGSVHEWSTRTALNVCMSKEPLWGTQHTIEALIPPRMSPQVKCTYREDTLPLKDIEDNKNSDDWGEPTVAIHCTEWSPFTITDWHNFTDHISWLRQVQWLWSPQKTHFVDNRGSPTLWIIIDCDYINGECGNQQIKH